MLRRALYLGAMLALMLFEVLCSPHQTLDQDPVAKELTQIVGEQLKAAGRYSWKYKKLNWWNKKKAYKNKKKKHGFFGRKMKVAASNRVQFSCAWQITVTADQFNIAFPDVNAVYHVLLWHGVSEDRILRIKGVFPKVRYFSFQTYDLSTGNPISSVVDHKMEPVMGVNPFNATQRDRAVGSYELYLTPHGNQFHGHKNELPFLPNGVSSSSCNQLPGCYVMLLFRVYTADPASNAFLGNDTGRLWGYVDKPTVSMKLKGRFLERWLPLTTCDSEKPTAAGLILKNKVDNIHESFDRNPYTSMNNNFIVYSASTSKKALFPNADASYLFATARNDYTDVGKVLVARITGVLPRTPMGVYEEEFASDGKQYDVRYVSLSTVVLQDAAPTVDTLMDTQIEAFYRQNSSHNTHEAWNRRYSIAIAPSKELARMCDGLYDETEDMFLANMYKGQLYPYQGFVYREILSRYQTKGVPDRSVAYARDTCKGASRNLQVDACTDSYFFRDALKDHYPKITYYYCNLGDYSLSHAGTGYVHLSRRGRPLGEPEELPSLPATPLSVSQALHSNVSVENATIDEPSSLLSNTTHANASTIVPAVNILVDGKNPSNSSDDAVVGSFAASNETRSSDTAISSNTLPSTDLVALNGTTLQSDSEKITQNGSISEGLVLSNSSLPLDTGVPVTFSNDSNNSVHGVLAPSLEKAEGAAALPTSSVSATTAPPLDAIPVAISPNDSATGFPSNLDDAAARPMVALDGHTMDAAPFAALPTNTSAISMVPNKGSDNSTQINLVVPEVVLNATSQETDYSPAAASMPTRKDGML